MRDLTLERSGGVFDDRGCGNLEITDSEFMVSSDIMDRNSYHLRKSAVRLVALTACLLCASAAMSADGVDFARDIRPILSENCFVCHGPDEGTRQTDLRLDTFEGATFDLGGYAAVVPGKPDESELYRRIASNDSDERMPPADSKLTLTNEQIDLIRRWVADGAEWVDHWAFIAPKAIALPQVSQPEWPNNNIDAFILSRMDQTGVEPAAEAPKSTLLRRVSFDLTGLPPTLVDLDRFLKDTRPGAYERAIDRLLASPRFGERMASDWLDVARYSDTYGYQVDRDRYVWPWRNWVIEAFNANQPYDQFITEQLAGDLLPDASDQQILATTFNRLHPQKVEGGSVPEEFRIEYVADRTQTFATAFLGLTLECARCHDHKFDPVTQKEYYQLSAFFDNIDEAGLYSFFTPAVPTPTLLLPSAGTKDLLQAARDDVATAEQQLSKVASDHRSEFRKWFRNSAKKHSGLTTGDAPQSESNERLLPGCIATVDFEGEISEANSSAPGRVGKAVRLTGDDGVKLDVGNFRRYEPFSISLWINTPDEKKRAVVFHRSRAWTDAASRGYQLLIEEGCLSASLIHFWPGNAIRVRTRNQIPVDQWLHVVMTYDGSSRASGLSISLNGQQVECEVVRDNLYKNITGGGGDTITIGQRFRDRGFTNGLVDEFRVFNRQLSGLEIAELYDGHSLKAALATPWAQLTNAQKKSLFEYYSFTQDTHAAEKIQDLQKARERLCSIEDGIDEIMVMRELPKPRPSFLLRRGAYNQRDESVDPLTPAILPPLGSDQQATRLELARWLTSPEHPLTARVTVNRFWQIFFGAGLVRTPEDFGSQGQLPTHPLLLDWLAHDFVSHGWNIKRLIRQIVTSSTYRQSSAARPKIARIDPENRLLARAPVYRLPAEMLRDNALAAAGLLVDRIGGPPAKPYEVEVSFKPVKRDSGEGLFRRSLYTYWKRTGPAPVMMALDASKRDVCRVRREPTSSPIQAFVLMNGPQFVEAARMLSQRLIQMHGADSESILVDLFRMLTSRHPTDSEIAIVRHLYQQQLGAFESNRDRAKKYLAIGDSQRDAEVDLVQHAAWTVVANTLFNFDECIMKR